MALTWKGGSIMQEALLSPLATWHSFYSIIGTAAATLTGLLFVVITLIAGVRVRVSSPGSGIAVFSTPNVVHFGAALLVAAILSAPWQALWTAGLLLGLAGLGGATYVIIVLRRVRRSVRRQTDYQPVLEDSSRRFCFQAIQHRHCSSSLRQRCCCCSSASTTPGITSPILPSNSPSRRTSVRTSESVFVSDAHPALVSLQRIGKRHSFLVSTMTESQTPRAFMSFPMRQQR